MLGRNAVITAQQLQKPCIAPTIAFGSHQASSVAGRSTYKRLNHASLSHLSVGKVERLLTNSLVCAGNYRSNKSFEIQAVPPRSHPRPRTRLIPPNSLRQTRPLHSQTTAPSQGLGVFGGITRNDYLGLLDYYGNYSSDETPSLYAEWQNLPHLEETAPKQAQSHYKSNYILANPQHLAAKTRAMRAIKNKDAPLEDVFTCYRALPYPGVKYIFRRPRLLLLRRLMSVERKTQKSTLQFLSVLEDMKAAGFAIPRDVWNSAIHVTARTLSNTTITEVEKALDVWKEMEQAAGVAGSFVTFNILFDVAIRAGEFKLGEMILQEMKKRKLPVKRFTRISLIYYQGLRGDGDGVRRTYREFVDTGEIVNTMVLNCVIESLIRAGEPTAAEHVYEKMKRMHAKMVGRKLPQLSRKSSRELQATLQKISEQNMHDKDYLSNIQSQQTLAPDSRTYITLIQYHASQSGELNSIVRLVEEMQESGLPMRGRIFMELFRGFATHGGVRYTAWTPVRLDNVWTTFVQLEEQGMEDLYIAKWIVIWALRAFDRCEGSQKALEIWDQAKMRWKPVADWDEVVLRIVNELEAGKRLTYPNS